MTTLPVSPQQTTESLERRFEACDQVSPLADPYTALLQRLRAEHVPFTVLWELTHHCNLQCVMCYNIPRPQPELSTTECLDILEQLAAAGTLRLTLTGGEILTRPDFFTIAERARALGFALDLKTNGTLLTPELADRLAALTPVQVDISLLGATEATFDAVTGSHATLRRVRRGVQLLQERGVRVKLNTLLLDLNVAEQRQMSTLAAELGVAYEQTFKVAPNDDGLNLADRHQLTTTQMTGVLRTDGSPFILKTRPLTSRTCAVGLSSCLISPYGVVYPCIELRLPAGDLRRQKFADIWSNSPLLTDLRERHTWANLPKCRVCPIQDYCEGRCAGLAWKEHGDLYGGHTLACQHAQARLAQLHPEPAKTILPTW
jgi:AdoMet-dependent heme synthase